MFGHLSGLLHGRHRLWLLSAVLLSFFSTEVSSRAFMHKRDVADDCVCDCCMNVQAEATTTGGASSGFVCAPRAGIESDPTPGEGACGSVCAASDEVRDFLGAKNNEVDYWRYCPAECHAVGEELNVLCVSDQLTTDLVAPRDMAIGHDPLNVPSASSDGSAPPPLFDASLSAPSPAVPSTLSGGGIGDGSGAGSGAGSGVADPGITGPGSESELVLAKALMNRARERAVTAGAAARAARQAYEEVLQSPQLVAQEATMREIGRLSSEAREQATFAQAVRRDFEIHSRKRAIEAAQKAALVYRKAWEQTAQIANQWAVRAAQFAKAATDREDIAQQSNAEAFAYHKIGNEKAARQKSGEAKRSQEQAEEFRRMSQEAHGKAETISAEKSWYDGAEKTAAQSALARELPPGVTTNWTPEQLPGIGVAPGQLPGVSMMT